MIFSLLRRLPNFKGKKRIINFLVSHKKQLTEKQFLGKYGIQYTIPNSYESIGSDLFANGVYEDDLIQMLSKRIAINGVFFDVGANIGSIAIPLHKLRPDIQIYCFEASPRVFSYLQKNCIKNNTSIVCINAAVAETDGLVVKFYSSKDKFGTGSMVPAFTTDYEEVKTLSLSEYAKTNEIKHIDCMKVDVEGFECGVFKGMAFLKEHIAEIIFEFCDWAEENSLLYKKGAAQQFLLDEGFELFDMTDNTHFNKLYKPLESGFTMLLAKQKKHV